MISHACSSSEAAVNRRKKMARQVSAAKQLPTWYHNGNFNRKGETP
jgi:hypothetical protein